MAPQLYSINVHQDATFHDLILQQKFIFRLHYNNRDAFMAKAFSREDEIPATYPDLRGAIDHIGSWSHTESEWISLSFSLPYMAYEARRRIGALLQHACITVHLTYLTRHVAQEATAEHSLFVSIIDGTRASLQARAILGIEAFPRPHKYSNRNTRQYNFASCFQEILVYGCIPAAAIVATVPWSAYRQALPVYCAPSGYTGFQSYCRQILDSFRRGRERLSIRASVEASMSLLGVELWLKAVRQCDPPGHFDIEKFASHVGTFATIICSWIYLPCPVRGYTSSATFQDAYPHFEARLRGEITSHPLYLRVRLTSLAAFIYEDAENILNEDRHIRQLPRHLQAKRYVYRPSGIDTLNKLYFSHIVIFHG